MLKDTIRALDSTVYNLKSGPKDSVDHHTRIFTALPSTEKIMAKVAAAGSASPIIQERCISPTVAFAEMSDSCTCLRQNNFTRSLHSCG